jgi:hypothetical protein
MNHHPLFRASIHLGRDNLPLYCRDLERERRREQRAIWMDWIAGTLATLLGAAVVAGGLFSLFA